MQSIFAVSLAILAFATNLAHCEPCGTDNGCPVRNSTDSIYMVLVKNLEEIRADRDCLQSQFNREQGVTSELKNQLTQLNSKIADFDAKLSESNSQLSESRKEVSDLGSQLSEAKAQILELQKEVDESSNSVKTSRALILEKEEALTLCKETAPLPSGLVGTEANPEILDLTGINVRNSTVCEGSTLVISCPGNHKLQILDANYGRTEGNQICPHDGIQTTNCISPNSAKIIKNLCDGKSLCSTPATNAVFQDPCAETRKYLKVSYECHEPKRVTANAQTITDDTRQRFGGTRHGFQGRQHWHARHGQRV